MASILSCPSWKSTVCDNQIMTRWLFVSQAKMQLRQVDANKNNFEIYLGCDTTLRVHDKCVWGQRSILGHVTFRGHSEYALGQGLYICLTVKTQLKVTHSQDLTSDLTYTHYDLTAWLHTYKLISKLFWFSLTWRNCISARHTKIPTAYYCHTPLIFQLAEDKTLIYLIRTDN